MEKVKKYVPWAISCVLALILVVTVTHGETKQSKNEAYRSNTFLQTILPDIKRSSDKISFIDNQRLPSLSRMSAEDSEQYVNTLQVIKKIAALGLDEQSFLYPEDAQAEIYAQLSSAEADTKQEVIFTGTTATELNEFLRNNAGKKILVQQKALEVSESIQIPDHTWLIGDQAELQGPGDTIAFYLENKDDVRISGFTVNNSFSYGVYVIGSKNIQITSNSFISVSYKPVVIMGTCSEISILNNIVQDNQQGGIYLNGDISDSLIEGNTIIDNHGTSNWMAGIVLTAIEVTDARNPYALFRPDLHFPEETRLDEMLAAPHQIVIRNNVVSGNNSSGVYCDGAYLVYISDNHIMGNDKEGLCLDYGTLGAYVARNNISGNGNRARQTDQDLENDFVLAAGRLEDGSSCSKLPGISIDNSAYNIIYNNRIEENYGSGVKMVRTGIRNIVSTNIIHNNNLGKSDTFHFFGIELGYAAADVEADNLDFAPDYENIVCRNIISGGHYAGIFLAEEVYINDFFDNVILDATDWSIESLSQKYNSTINNLSQIPSRGISLSTSSGSVIILPGMSG